MNNTKREELENLSLAELKEILVELRIHGGKGNRSKKYYIDLIDKHYSDIAEKQKLAEIERNEIKIKTQKFFLNQKRDTKSPLKKFSLPSSEIIDKSVLKPIRVEFASSKSLKDLRRTSNKVLSKNDFISQCAFKLEDNKSCCIENFLKNLDYREVAKVSAGCLIVFACYYYLQKSEIQLSTIKDSLVNHKEIVVAVVSMSVGALVAYSVISYIVSKQKYDDLCREIADKSFNDIVGFMEEEINDGRPYLEEEVILSLLSEKYNIEREIYVDTIYNKYLKKKLFDVYSFVRKDLIDEGEIKSFWIFEQHEQEQE